LAQKRHTAPPACRYSKSDIGIRGHPGLWPKGHGGKDSLRSAAAAIDGARGREKSNVFSVE